MALLTKATRKKWMKLLGYEYNKDGILKMQKKYFKRKQYQDGVYGSDTDKLLRHLHHVYVYTNHDNFSPEEFRCPCGHCTGYPTWMRVNELKNIQAIRTHYGKPMTITSGLRCSYENSRVQGASDSAHLKGKAVDFVIKGYDDLDGRKRVINYAKKLKHHNYSYCNNYDSNGKNRNSPGMVNAIHTEVV